ncbi:MAG TPA: HDIG domain-containing protein [Anaerovoracaceae bacterium]|nr:HDIG domain-containing protein [Anaerovoracaceae bacterium]
MENKRLSEETEKKRLFHEMQAHLLNDDAPSAYFSRICDEGILDEYPFSMLSRLEEVPQSPKHHPEGNVWNHTMLVIDEAARKKDKSRDRTAFMWAALLHDIGKAETTKDDRGRITAYDHDRAGAPRAEEFLKEFLDDKVQADKELIRRIVALVRWHMQILFVVKSMKFADIKTMRENVVPEEVALLGYCDRMGRLNADRKAENENLKLFLSKCREWDHRRPEKGR